MHFLESKIYVEQEKSFRSLNLEWKITCAPSINLNKVITSGERKRVHFYDNIKIV
jgi:hypothetical protein